jgi:hypothetical protein
MGRRQRRFSLSRRILCSEVIRIWSDQDLDKDRDMDGGESFAANDSCHANRQFAAAAGNYCPTQANCGAFERSLWTAVVAQRPKCLTNRGLHRF